MEFQGRAALGRDTMSSLRRAASRGFEIAGLALILAVAPVAPLLAQESEKPAAASNPGWGAKTVDLAILRPVSFGQSLAGSAMFLAVLPLTLLSGKDNRRMAYEIFVETPVDETFRRRLGRF